MHHNEIPFLPKTASRNEWRQYHIYRRRRASELAPEDPVTDDQTVESIMKRENDEEEETIFVLIDSKKKGAIVGFLSLGEFKPVSRSYETNKHLMFINFVLLNEFRNKNIGKSFLRFIYEFATKRNKKLIITSTIEEDGKRFAKKIGAEEALAGRENRLHLENIDFGMLESWVAEGRRKSPESKLEFYSTIPDSIIEAFAVVYTDTFNQQPWGTMKVGRIVFTPETIRKRESDFKSAGLIAISAAIVEKDGKVSGLTEMMYIPSKETIINQNLTGVLDDQRGRGLGKWLKAAMLLKVRQDFPKVRIVSTTNAESNAAMLSINDRLGFKKHKETSNIQIRVEDLAKYLATLKA